MLKTILKYQMIIVKSRDAPNESKQIKIVMKNNYFRSKKRFSRAKINYLDSVIKNLVYC